jgi:hypothetical protein
VGVGVEVGVTVGVIPGARVEVWVGVGPTVGGTVGVGVGVGVGIALGVGTGVAPMTWKLAMALLAEFMVRVQDGVSPPQFSDHPVNHQPELGVACNVAWVPHRYCPPPVAIPPPRGLALAVRV